MIWDTHMHTNFSGDSDARPESMIEQAIALGLPGICITDHLDLLNVIEPDLNQLDLDRYSVEIPRLQEQYAGRIEILFGIELGVEAVLADRLDAIVKGYPFDFVIGSSHGVDGLDPWYPEYFKGRTAAEGYRAYFASILENIHAFQNFDSYGHLDYVVRYGADPEHPYRYEDYADIYDEILLALIRHDKALEVNTAGFKYGLGRPNPGTEVIRRYRELGGTLLTVGADGHKPEHIAYAYDRIEDLLVQCGFDSYTVYKKRQPVQVKL